jgi:hypothetical protein
MTNMFLRVCSPPSILVISKNQLPYWSRIELILDEITKVKPQNLYVVGGGQTYDEKRSRENPAV